MIAHIGLPKAASTFLQQHYFPNLQKYKFFTPEFQHSKEFNGIFKLNSSFDGIFPGQTARYTPTLNKHEKKQLFLNNERSIISAEGLFGVGFCPEYTFKKNMNYLKHHYGVTRVILVLRFQLDYCKSLHTQLVLKEKRWSRNININDFWSGDKSTIGDFTSLDWSRYIEDLNDIFGTSNVCVVLYEELVKNPRSFIEKLSKFLDDSVPNLDTTNRTNQTLPYTNYNSKRYFWRNFEITKINSELADEIKNWSNNRNRRLNEFTEIDLKEMGYV